MMTVDQNTLAASKTASSFGDGTFKYCPRYFYQLYTLLGYKNGRYVPCVFFLLPSKSGECYTNMFRYLIEVARDFGHNFKKLSPKNTFNHFPITDSSLLYSVARPRLCIFRHQAWVK
jgi:hypothetical protein